MLYADSRGVFRVYQMSLFDGVWKLTRQASGFSQRFVGAWNADGRTIRGRPREVGRRLELRARLRPDVYEGQLRQREVEVCAYAVVSTPEAGEL
jgi:hypothetical protein